jgi:hypothetical protein
MVGANVTVKAGTGSSGELVYQGKNQLTFGFKVFQTFYENGAWRVRGVQAAGDLAFGGSSGGGAEEVVGQPMLLNPGGMIRFRQL